jgi:hypothetical protein
MYNNDTSYEIDTCGICLNQMKHHEKYQQFECSHYFHKKCIHKWNRSCPICRNSSYKNKTHHVDISGFRDMPNEVPFEYHHIYLKTWKKEECIRNNHHIIFRRPYGVFGACETCGYFQPFNLSHPISRSLP